MALRPDTSFSKQMRMATRDVHKLSDNLVNAKLAFGKKKKEITSLLIFSHTMTHFNFSPFR